MRLSCVESGHTPERTQMLGSMREMMMGEPPDVVKTILYRPELFGSAFSDVTHETMRGESEWSAGERELLAAFVSKANQCPF